MNFSKYQQAVFDHVQNSTRSLIVEAVAGSGKTTTIVHACNLIPEVKDILFLAFNKSIVETLKQRLPPGVNCATFNSTGWRAWLSFSGKKMIKLESHKINQIIKDKFRDADQEIYGAFVNRMVALGRSEGLTPDDDDERWFALMDWHDVSIMSEAEDVSYARGMDLVKKTLRMSIDQAKYVSDFDDQIYMPWLRDVAFPKYDVVFIDEAQDVSKIQVALLKRMLKPGGKLIAVGDPYQAIYGFRGADSSSLENIRQAFDADVLPLSISYRCCKSVIAEAQKYMPGIEAFEQAPEGEVRDQLQYSVNDFEVDDVILCRNTAPLVGMAYQLISRGRKINFHGREIGKGLITLIRKMKARSIPDLSDRLSEWLERESIRLEEKGKEDQIQALEDKKNCIDIFISNLTSEDYSIGGLIMAIENLFESNGRGVSLSTGHKAKGGEWDRVYILDKHLMPSKWAKKPWMQTQERNLTYVAVTRAKESLVYISSDCWSDKDSRPQPEAAPRREKSAPSKKLNGFTF